MGRTKKAKAQSVGEQWHLFKFAKERLEQHPELPITEVKVILDCASKMARLAKKEDDTEMQVDAVRVQLRAKRRIGQMAFGTVD
jgi:hypothetical protein